MSNASSAAKWLICSIGDSDFDSLVTKSLTRLLAGRGVFSVWVALHRADVGSGDGRVRGTSSAASARSGPPLSSTGANSSLSHE